MKANKIAEKSDRELQKMIKDLKNKLLKSTFDVTSKETNNHRDIRNTKKEIARVKTIIRERALAKELQKANKEKK